MDRGNHARGGGVGAESHSSSRGSQRSSRSIAEAAHRYSSSLSAINNHSSGLGPSSRPHLPNRPKTGSAWSQQNEEQLGGDESESYYSRRAHSRHSATAIIRDALKRHEKSEPAAAAEPDRSSLERRWGATRGACKDAGAQAELTPKARNGPFEQLQRLDNALLARTPSVENEKQHSVVEDLVREVPQFPGGREAEVRPSPGLSRYAPHAVPDVGCRPFEEIQSYGRDWDLLDRGESVGKRAGPLLRWNFQDPAAESINRANKHNHTYEGHCRMEDPDSISGNVGLENLEEFIQRIEDEAAMPLGEIEDAWVLPEGEFGVLGCPTARPLDFGDEGDAEFVSSRDLFSLGGDLLAPYSTAISDAFPREAGFACSTSLSMLKPYPLENLEGGLSPASIWQGRGMF